jgi:hypothetical protein
MSRSLYQAELWAHENSLNWLDINMFDLTIFW